MVAYPHPVPPVVTEGTKHPTRVESHIGSKVNTQTEGARQDWTVQPQVHASVHASNSTGSDRSVNVPPDSSSASEDLPVSFPGTTPPSTPQEGSMLDQYEHIRTSMKNHEMELTRQQMELVNGEAPPTTGSTDPTIHSRELYSAFPAKTPPSTPLEASTLAQYEKLRNSVDATEVSVQLRQDITISTPEGSTTRSIYDTFAEQARMHNGETAEVVDEETASSNKRASVESTDRMSPALSRGSFHLLEGESDEAMFPVAQGE